MTAIILQARLDSTRLPRKALLDLAGRPVIVRVMETLGQVEADMRVLACDYDSERELAPLAERSGFVCIAGPKEDVLERFCKVIRETGADVVLRATGDNPFLFAGAATASLKRFAALRERTVPADYFTYTGLPHGSGIEVFSGTRLLEAASGNDSPYDREHVGPAFYNHPGHFVSIREPAPEQWYHPELRTTIDTPEDYARARVMANHLLRAGFMLPAPDEAIVEAAQYADNPLLFVPTVKKGEGTGHFARSVSLIQSLSSTWRCLLYIPEDCADHPALPQDFSGEIVRTLPEGAHLVILDRFRSAEGDMAEFRRIGPVLAIDEGGKGRPGADYLLDIIPSLPYRSSPPNLLEPRLLPLPSSRKKEAVGSLRSVLVLAGGENAAGLALPVGRAFASLFPEVTVIDPAATGVTLERSGLTVSGPVPSLRETLFRYDLVVTHYGFTAFEALAAGCRVILLSPTRYHYRLALEHGFSALPPGEVTLSAVRKILGDGIRVPEIITPLTGKLEGSQEIDRIARGNALSCPLCGATGSMAVARYPDRTVSRCPTCRMLHLSFVVAENRVYSRSYFFEEYRSQYGKTYLEDFDSIRLKGAERLATIDAIAKRLLPGLSGEDRSLLDVGCAYGPFLAAARDAQWVSCGTDISDDAVRHVREVLHIPAAVSAFPAPDADGLLENRRFAVVTLWYVIEHFEDLDPVLRRIRSLLIPGGIIAFSTPSASGVSGRFNRKSFLQNSPKDHFTIWDPRTVRAQLARFGFSVVKVISTGHHPERFPFMKGKGPESPAWGFLLFLSKLLRLGDTFEVYAVKRGDLEDIQR
jgi:spore coat polysaccharide biosynthesis protein SpsF (cytidylyltransferase family)/2-polyprenyl-3-methyl-5-hydroxy-6-metoxy-1,4-benzoquinol methylase